MVPEARHIDLYDRTDLIPFDQLDNSSRRALGRLPRRPALTTKTPKREGIRHGTY